MQRFLLLLCLAQQLKHLLAQVQIVNAGVYAHELQAMHQFAVDEVFGDQVHDQLLQGITDDYNDFRLNSGKSVDLFKNERLYSVERIERFYAPVLRDFRVVYLKNGKISIFITNYGAKGTLVAIENDPNTHIKWMDIPLEIEEASISSGSQPNCLTLRGTEVEYNVPYKFKLIVEDDMKRRSTYEVEGINDHPTLLRLD